eukprot:TRINITY_DN4471_c0_g3_i1.p1 TRINITY_DN4471_c0_g3~~TRINITY_DN4471_c0_g3_i1.p1  ORF type:complete len:508 (+),score=84.18 TRINITY_DN4471_c0_g3_i1:42-1565(+)
MKVAAALVLLLIGSVALAGKICPDGQYLKGNDCASCSGNCLLCNEIGGKENCRSCKSGFSIEFKEGVATCIECVKGCKNCKSNTAEGCLNVENGAAYNSKQKKIFKCPASCSSCSEDDKCETCAIGYFLNEKKCQACPTGCGACALVNNNQECTKCFSDYTLIAKDKTCRSCSTIGKNCISCNEDKCLRCSAGFVLKDNKCVECPANCAACADGAACTKCTSRFFLKADKTCGACPGNCLECEEEGKCKKCIANLGIKVLQNVNGKCVTCPTNCQECTEDGNTCTKCWVNARLTENKRCVTVTGCAKVSADGKCEQCKPQFKLKADKTCTRINCNAGEGVDKDGVCVDCPLKNCKVCDAEAKVCHETVEGYYFDGDVKPCPAGCKTCEIRDNALQCTDLADPSFGLVAKPAAKSLEVGYFCDSSCGKCSAANDAWKCDTCANGFILSVEKEAPDSPTFCVDSSIPCPSFADIASKICVGHQAPPKSKNGISLVVSTIISIAALLYML